MAQDGIQTRSKYYDEQFKQMKEAMEKMQSDFEKIRDQREEVQTYVHQQHLQLQAQISMQQNKQEQQQNKLEQQVSENKTQLDKIESMLSLMMKKLGDQGASSSVVNSTKAIPLNTSPHENSTLPTPPLAQNTPDPSTIVTTTSSIPISHNSPEKRVPEIPLTNPWTNFNVNPYQFAQHTTHPINPHIPIPISPINSQTNSPNMQINQPNFMNLHQTPFNTQNINQVLRNPLNLPFPKLDFPVFTGDNPRGWLFKCEKYFQLNPVAEILKVHVASMHMQDRADTWMQGIVRPGILWEEFAHEVIERFERKSTLGIVGEFNKLRQLSDVDSYRCKFEELKLLLMRSNPILDESYFITSFMSALREDLRLTVLSCRPKSLKEVYEVAVYQELIAENRNRQKFNSESTNVQQHTPNQTKTSNKCRRCHNPWLHGHKCKDNGLNTMTGEEVDERKVHWMLQEEEYDEQNAHELLLPDPKNSKF